MELVLAEEVEVLMKKYLKHVVHGVAVYVAALVPQLLTEPVDRSLLLSLVPGLVAAVVSAVWPQADSLKVEQAVEKVLPTTTESKLAPVATPPTS